MALVEFQYEPVSLDVNKVCFEEEQDIYNTREKSRKSQSVTEWSRSRKYTQMLSTWVAAKLKLSDAFSYRIWGIFSVIGYEIR